VGFSIQVPLIGNLSLVKMLHLFYTAQNLLFRIFYVVLFMVLLMQNVFDSTFGDIFSLVPSLQNQNVANERSLCHI